MKKEATKKTDKKNMDAKKDMVEVVFILDRSGSMSGMEEDTIGGFNSMLKEQKKESDNIIWSTVLFDHETEVVHDRVPVEKVRDLDEDTYYVRGSTALLDAVGGAIHHIGNVHKYAREEDRPKRTLFVITTDGLENSSVIYSYRKVKQMIKRQKDRYDWEFVFLGANMDAVEVAGRIGIDADRAARYHCDELGIKKNMSVVSKMVRSVASFEDTDRDYLREVRADYEARK